MKHSGLVMPEADMLIHCGDFSRSGGMWELRTFNEWLGTLDYKHVLINAGNHDWNCFPPNVDDAKKAFTNATLLIDESITIEGLRFYFSPWTREYKTWAYMKSKKELETFWEQTLPKNVDVLVTHEAPFGVLDIAQSAFGSMHLGCESLVKWVVENKPRYNFFGHIHGGYGRFKTPSTEFVNASISQEYPNQDLNQPVVIEI